MIKMIVAVYLCLIATVLGTTALFARVLYGGEVGAAPGIESNFRGGVKLAIERLQVAEKRSHALQHLSEAFGYDVEIIKHPFSNVSQTARDRLAAGEEMAWYPSITGSYIVAPLSPSEVVRFGPLPGSQTPAPTRWTFAHSAAALVLGLATLLLAWPVGRHLQRFEAATHRLSRGDYSARMALGGPFLRQAGRAFNHMAEKTQALVESQRSLLRAVSHELRTPLARLRFEVERLSTVPDGERLAAAKDCDDELDGVDRLVDELLTYTRLDATEMKPDVAELNPSDVIEGLALHFRAQHPELSLHLHASGQPARIHVDVVMFQRAIRNLLDNAARYAGSQVGVIIRSTGEEVVVDVDDDGPGIPLPDRTRVFEPFVRLQTSDARRGSFDPGVGLGLAIVSSVIAAHGGQVAVLDAPGGGCRMRTSWPAARESA